MPNVQVAIRCRPALPQELSNSRCDLIECNEVNNTVRISGSSQQQQSQDKVFKFDKILAEHITQEDVFDYFSPMIEHALNGLHSTVFAYGQTGSGKTFTMEGVDYKKDSGVDGKVRPILDTDKSRHGIVPRTVEAVFERAHARMKDDPNVQYKIKCSFMQLYNEKVTDLLNPSSSQLKQGLKIRWNRNDQFSVENLFVFECDSAEQVRELFFMGVKNKAMGSHNINAQSSRSHCLFTIYIHSWEPNSPDCVIKSELTLVDLAGSEKLAMLSSDPSPQLLRESIEINTSLLALGKVITSLSSKAGSGGKGALSHVPYRDSKLTRLLKHALGGNSMTMMMACINPANCYLDETVSTLMYAGRAQNIKNEPRVNEDPRAALIRELREQIMSLKQELVYYRQLALEGATSLDVVEKLKALSGGGHNGENSNADGATVPTTTGGLDSVEVEAQNQLLADKLVQSCTMLKNVVGLNGQLRDAFDKLNTLKKESEQRELQLNAENLELRERIELLESLALNGDETDDNDEGHGTRRPRSNPNLNSNSSVDQSFDSSSVSASREFPSALPKHHHRQQQQQRDPLQAFALERGNQLRAHANSSSSSKDRFVAYNEKYRNPKRSSNYADYYELARKATSSSKGKGTSSSSSSSKNSTAVQEMERLLKKLPPTTQSLIPQSLQKPGSFGELSFGGTANETQDLEQRRLERQRRREELQEKHRLLQAGFSGGVSSSGQGLPTSSASSSYHHLQDDGYAGSGGGGGYVFSNNSGNAGSFLPPSQQQQQQQQYSAVSNISSNFSSGSGSGRAAVRHNATPPLQLGLTSASSDLRPGSSSQHRGGSSGSVASQHSNSNTSARSQLFSYITQDESKSLFSQQQLDILTRRSVGGAGGGHQHGHGRSSGGSGGALNLPVGGGISNPPLTRSSSTGSYNHYR